MLQIDERPAAREPLAALLASKPGRMIPRRDPTTGMITMERGPDVPPTDEDIVVRLTLDLLDHLWGTQLLDEAQHARIRGLVVSHAFARQRPSADRMPILRELAIEARHANFEAYVGGHAYEHSDRLLQSIDAILWPAA